MNNKDEPTYTVYINEGCLYISEEEEDVIYIGKELISFSSFDLATEYAIFIEEKLAQGECCLYCARDYNIHETCRWADCPSNI